VISPGTFNPDRDPPAPQTLTGTNKGEEITGGNGRDRLIGNGGADRLTGGPGADIFERSYNDRSADKIIDFQPGVDKILITDVPRDSYTGKWISRQRELIRDRVVRNVASESAAEKSATPFAYVRDTGSLYLNANGKKNGFGAEGGLIAELSEGLALRRSDVTVSFADPLG
jgi:Ca2+-binding RTX toxin-like protein